ncbi:hypothetical protein ACFQL1_05915 [Halomicroarcula sp. GCM10025709]|uniref:DUF7504 family protein n=1 Tax=Haloarcula TaxID=2237 RepID=UPI0024C21F9F|nr:hypothetical protein [Halomicroarcula sp. YJ-61-S]
MDQLDTQYGFGDLPLSPVGPGTSILVAGPILGGTRRFALEMLTAGTDDGVVVITADVSAQEVLAGLDRTAEDATDGRIRVVDCTQDRDGDLGEFVASVGTPADLTGVGIEYAGQYEQVYARGFDAVRTGIYTLTPLLVYSDDVRPVYRFVNTVASRIRTADGFGVCVIDPRAHDERVLGSIAQAFDGRIDLRESDTGHELKVRGLPGQPTEWTPVEG